jgi:hypothetical protein
MDDLRPLLRANWRKVMPLRAARPRGVRRHPRGRDEAAALRELSLRVGRRAFQTWLLREGPRRYRLVSGLRG